MDISIAMCTYNGGKFLVEQLNSIREQTKLPSELIVCDDGSIDNTSQLVQDFATSAPFPVVLIRNQVTLGSTINFDRAIGRCRGQVIALCDQDDLWARNKLQRVEQVLDAEPEVGGLFSNAFLVNEKSEILPESLWERRRYTPRMQAEFRRNGAAQLLKYNPATGATVAFRSRFVRQITPIPREWVHDAWIALLIAMQSPLRLLPEKLMSYRIHGAQQIGLNRTAPSDDLLVNRWNQLHARVATLSPTSMLDPVIARVVHRKLHFLEVRRALRERDLVSRLVAASRDLPGYFHFARGLFSYVRDVAQVSRVKL